MNSFSFKKNIKQCRDLIRDMKEGRHTEIPPEVLSNLDSIDQLLASEQSSMSFETIARLLELFIQIVSTFRN